MREFNKIKSLLKDWLPPVICRWILRFRSQVIDFEKGFSTWKEAIAHSTGYESDLILSKVLDSTMKVKQGEYAFERDSVLFDKDEFDWPVVSGLMWAAAQNGGILNVLDFGGALGSSYFQNRRFLDKLIDLKWNVIEQSHFVQAGKLHIQDDKLRFYFNIEEYLTENQPNVVLISGVLQYLEDPVQVIERLTELGSNIIILDRTIVNQSTEHKNYVQNVSASIYSTSYPCRSLAESKLMEYFYPEYQLESSFPSLSFPALEKIDSMFKGFLFTKVHQ
jgi:putative methyltransferase (TIGR04325 family)